MEQKVSSYRELPELFTMSSLSGALHINRRRLSRMLESWVEEGVVVRLRKGTYAKSDANQFRIAAGLYNGYIGFSSALYLYGLKTELERIVYVCVSTREKTCYFKGVKLQPIEIQKQLYGTELHDGTLVSTYPKTIFDMFLKPKHASMFDVYRAINTRPFDNREWMELIYYAKDSNLSTMRRIGFALDGIAPAWFTAELLSLAKGSGKSFFGSKKTANFNSKWRIYDNIGVRRWVNAI